MAYRSFAVVAVQLFLFKINLVSLCCRLVRKLPSGRNVALCSELHSNVYSQCVNRVVPNCGQNIVPELMISTPTPCMSPLMMERPLEIAPTIIQDSSVANSLANALQLLVVSNLLSSTLPSVGCELLAPAFSPVEVLPNFAPIEVIGGGLLNPYGSPYNLPGYNYIY